MYETQCSWLPDTVQAQQTWEFAQNDADLEDLR